MTDTSLIGVAGGRIQPERADRLFDEAKEVASRLGVEILLMDAEMVFGKAHLDSAVVHAFRAFERGTNVADTRMMEVMLYASGERQLSTAIKKMGVKEGTTRVAVVVSEVTKLDAVLSGLKVERDDAVLEGDVESLVRFGISRQTIHDTPEERRIDLVLERVAVVDMLK